MKFGYNTNGWQGTAIDTAIDRLARLGYEAVEIAPLRDQLGPESWTSTEASRIRRLVADSGMIVSNLHAGVRGLIADEHALISVAPVSRAIRVDLIERAVDFAAELGTDLVCVTSGAIPQTSSIGDAWSRLVDGLEACAQYARPRGIRIALEPEPELFIKSVFEYLELRRRLGEGVEIGLNLDIGHSQCLFEDIPAIIQEVAPLIWHVHVEDIAARVHRHLVPGQGQVNFHSIGRALAETGYGRAVSMELMDHSAEAEEVARHSLAVMRTWRRSIRAA